MTLAAGARLGPYEIIGVLGAGGMGEVYRARDTRLDRDVAVKILPSQTSRDSQTIARFEQESRAVAALSHPNILAIHDVGREGDAIFAVMELLEGQTLRDLLQSSPARASVPLRKAVEILLQVAQGLAAAHAKGITHRDIKPENVFVTSDGHVKILDFGLAKFDEKGVGPDAIGETRTVVRTDAGTVVGTSGYVSPEQAQALAVDFRSDIFSFGAVLYEVVTGARAFKGDSTIDTLHRIVHGTPEPVAGLCPDAPTELRWVIAKCLAKDPDERYQSTRDLVVDLNGVRRVIESSASMPSLPATAPAGDRRRVASSLVAVTALVVAGATAGWWLLGRSVDRGPIATPDPLSIERITSLGTVIDAAISPDGKYVTYVVAENARQGLWIRQLATSSTLELVPPGPVGFWGVGFSTDGSQIYYGLYSPDDPTRSIFRIPALGGSPRKLVSGIDSRPVFSPDGRRMAYLRGSYPGPGTSALMTANADGSDVKVLATRRAPEFFVPIFFTAPAWSPDGSIIVVPMERRTDRIVGTFVAVNAATGVEIAFPQHEFPGVGQAAWTPDGQGLIAVATETTSGRRIAQLWWISARSSTRRRVTNDLLDYRTASITGDGTSLVTVAADATASVWTAPIDGSGDARRISAGRYDGVNGLASAPGGRILYRSLESGTASLWVMDADGGTRRQITTDGVAAWPAATPHGRSMVFTKAGSGGLWEIALDGTGERRIAGPSSALFPTVTPDAKWILYVSGETGDEVLWKVPAGGGAPARVLDAAATRPAISPDGTHVAFYYQKSDDAPYELAVMPLDGDRPTATFRVAPSTGFSTVRWTADGKALLHNTAIGDRTNIWLQPLTGGEPRKVTRFADQTIFGFDRSADGKTLIIARGVLSRDAVLIRSFR